MADTSRKIAWTEEAVALLRQLAADGYSTQQMADALMGRFDVAVSRNAVVGKCHREGIVLTSPGSYAGSKPAARPVRKNRNTTRGSAQARPAPESGAAPMPPGAASGGDREGVSLLPVAEIFADALAACAPRPTPASGSGEGAGTVLPVDPVADLADAEEYDPALDGAYDVLTFEIAPEVYFGPTRFIESRSDQCKWFTTASSAYDAPVCGARHMIGFSYCDEHAKRVHTTAGLDPDRRRALDQIRSRRRHMGLSLSTVGA